MRKIKQRKATRSPRPRLAFATQLAPQVWHDPRYDQGDFMPTERPRGYGELLARPTFGLAQSRQEMQTAFLNFHRRIKLGNTVGNSTLREKREVILKRLYDKSLRFSSFLQGSFAMGTGVQPVRGDFDIDVGLIFTGYSQPDPLDLKALVYNAVLGHTPVTEWRRHCIRVQYANSYHVDLAAYWQPYKRRDIYLAVGKQFSGPEGVEWLSSNPRGLLSCVRGRFPGRRDAEQFARIIRYLKRWKDLQFLPSGNAAPTGISLTVAALQWFRPQRLHRRSVSSDGYDDLGALLGLVETMLRNFTMTSQYGEEPTLRIVASLPVLPHNDIFSRMTGNHMWDFRSKLDELASHLKNAMESGSFRPLLEVYGNQFLAEDS